MIELAHEPTKLRFARKSSDYGKAFESFNTLISTMNQLQQEQIALVEKTRTKIASKKDHINQKQQSLGEKKGDVMEIASSIGVRATIVNIFFVLIGLLSVAVAIIISSYLAKNMIDAIILAGDFANK